MWLFLDESGDLGFNFSARNSSRYFVITILACTNQRAVDLIRKAVKKTLRNKLHSKKRRPSELKGTETTFHIKKYFYRSLARENAWHLYAIVLDKIKLAQKLPNLPAEHRLYNYLSKEILQSIDLSNLDANIILVVDKRKGSKGIK